MAVGGDGIPAVRSYLAVGKESTFGSYASATTAVAFISSSFRTDIETLKLDQIGVNRGFMGRVTLGKSVEGSIETYFHPVESALLVAAALGGPVVSTASGTAIYHSISAGNFDTTTAIQSLSFNHRKGTTNVFRYQGGRVNTLKLSGNVGEPIMLEAEIVFKDSTLASDDIANTITYSQVQPFTFVNGVFRYQSTETLAATTTAQEPIQSFELTINNNIVSDEGARSLGTITVDVLPPTRREIEFKVTQRWDTTTTYNRFIQATQGAIELNFAVGSITATDGYRAVIRLPKVYNVTGDTEIGGADELLSTEITYDVVLDSNAATTTSRDIGVTIVNTAASY